MIYGLYWWNCYCKIVFRAIFCFFGSHSLPCWFLQLDTNIPNDMITAIIFTFQSCWWLILFLLMVNSCWNGVHILANHKCTSVMYHNFSLWSEMLKCYIYKLQHRQECFAWYIRMTPKGAQHLRAGACISGKAWVPVL